MNHRNKIQSLVSPTGDPGDAPDCMCESGPLYLEYGHICHRSANFFKIRGFPATQVGFCHPGAAKTAKKHASLKIWPTARKRQRNHQKLKKLSKMKKIFLRKPANFQPLMRGTAKQHGFFAHWGQFGRERRAWPNGADPPIFRIRVFP